MKSLGRLFFEYSCCCSNLSWSNLHALQRNERDGASPWQVITHKSFFPFFYFKEERGTIYLKISKKKKKKKRQNYLKAATDLANIRFTLAPDWAGIRLCGAITASNFLNGFVTGDGQLAAGEASLSYLTHFFDMCYKVMQQCPNANRENVLSGLSFVRSFCLPCTFFFLSFFLDSYVSRLHTERAQLSHKHTQTQCTVHSLNRYDLGWTV